MTDHLLAIDQGTTSTRAMVFDVAGRIRGQHQRELPQIFPADGWVEHDPEEIWRGAVACIQGAIDSAGLAPGEIGAAGITNQRETTVLWERSTGRPVHNAIVWQDRRTASLCREWIAAGLEEPVRASTGLVIDAYFSASKLAWLLDNVSGARAAAEAGELAFGTIDSFLIWRLTGGTVHATDATNASRTMLFDIHAQDWDQALLDRFGIPRSVLPEVRDSAGDYATIGKDIAGAEIPLRGVAGDQQAALVGQACFDPGMIKSTYGTGCFALTNTGTEAVESRNRLLTTVAYRIGGETTYALEGSIFVAGAAVQWLRDGLRVIEAAPEVEALAAGVDDSLGVYMVPAFVGLGAPYWDAGARGAILGLTRDAGVAHIARATLDSVAYQTRDLTEAMAADGATPAALRVDGGMTVNGWLMQRLADLVGLPVERPAVVETTALGAACLAGLGAGIYGSLADVAATWWRDAAFEPAMDAVERDRLYAGWRDAVARVRSG